MIDREGRNADERKATEMVGRGGTAGREPGVGHAPLPSASTLVTPRHPGSRAGDWRPIGPRPRRAYTKRLTGRLTAPANAIRTA